MTDPDYKGLEDALKLAERALRETDDARYRSEVELSSGKLVWGKKSNRWGLLWENENSLVPIWNAPIVLRLEGAARLGLIWDGIVENRSMRVDEIDEGIRAIADFVRVIERQPKDQRLVERPCTYCGEMVNEIDDCPNPRCTG